MSVSAVVGRGAGGSMVAVAARLAQSPSASSRLRPALSPSLDTDSCLRSSRCWHFSTSAAAQLQRRHREQSHVPVLLLPRRQDILGLNRENRVDVWSSQLSQFRQASTAATATMATATMATAAADKAGDAAAAADTAAEAAKSASDTAAVAAAKMSQTAEVAVTKSATTSVATETTAAATASETTAAATTLDGKQELILDFLPDRPTPLDPSGGGGDVSALVEPTLESLGLATWWPPGRMQYFLETLHTSADLPWWAAIALATLCMRLVTFPLVVMAQRNAGHMANNAPAMQELQAKMSDARRRGDLIESNQLGVELQTMMKKQGINPIKNLAPMLLQLPIFMSMFFGLRGMCYLPVESLSSGGALWFADLTDYDPYYALPLLTSSTLYLQLKFAADGASLDQAGPIARGIFKAMPIVLFPLVMNFPAAIVFYWFTTNCISVVQAKFVRLPGIREKLGIPAIIRPDPSKVIAKPKTFRAAVRESIDNWKVQADIVDRRSFDEQAFREAGMSKAPRTYKFDPTKPYEASSSTYSSRR